MQNDEANRFPRQNEGRGGVKREGKLETTFREAFGTDIDDSDHMIDLREDARFVRKMREAAESRKVEFNKRLIERALTALFGVLAFAGAWLLNHWNGGTK